MKRELRVVTRLSQYIKDGKEASKLVDVLLPFLKAKKRMDQGGCSCYSLRTEVVLAVHLNSHIRSLGCLPMLFSLKWNRKVQIIYFLTNISI